MMHGVAKTRSTPVSPLRSPVDPRDSAAQISVGHGRHENCTVWELKIEAPRDGDASPQPLSQEIGAMTIQHLTAAEMMSDNIVTVPPEASLRDAMLLMHDACVSSLPVVDEEDRCLGVISVRDILNCEVERERAEALQPGPGVGSYYDPDTDTWEHVALVGDPSDLPNREVREVMTEQVIFVHPSAPVLDVAEAMVSQGLHHILVIGADRRLHGVISSLDFVKLTIQTPV